MVISDEHRYVFIELPLTGTAAIRAELCCNYGGRRILNKHSTYLTYLAQASQQEKDFSFSCIRNPMDAIVSQYFKLKSDHWNFESAEKIARRNWLNRAVFSRRRLRQFRFIRDKDADFAEYFLRFYRRPYSNWSVLSHRDLDFIIRFETLGDDFAMVLNKLGIPMVRPLPVRNSTRGRDRDFLSYYEGETIERAKKVFSLFMAEWGYSFPDEWGQPQISMTAKLQYAVLNAMRTVYWTRLKHDL